MLVVVECSIVQCEIMRCNPPESPFSNLMHRDVLVSGACGFETMRQVFERRLCSCSRIPHGIEIASLFHAIPDVSIPARILHFSSSRYPLSQSPSCLSSYTHPFFISHNSHIFLHRVHSQSLKAPCLQFPFSM